MKDTGDNVVIARKNTECDIYMIVSNDKKHFFCIHSDHTMMRTWEPPTMMDVNEAAHHIGMHRASGHKVPEGLEQRIQLQYMLQD